MRISSASAAISFFHPSTTRNHLDDEMDAALQAGVEVEKLARAKVQGFDSGPCLHFPRQGQFHPLKYLNGVLAAFKRAGGRVYGGTGR